MPGMAPIKVDAMTDRSIAHAAHFLGLTKKALVDEAVREYVERHRGDIQQGVAEALSTLDGSSGSAVSLMTGFSASELEELGGLPAE